MELVSKETLDKFSRLTNAQAYMEIFHRRLMKPLPESKYVGDYRGNSQRANYYPHLRRLLTRYAHRDEVRVLDIGAGSGEVVEAVLKDYRLTVSPIEPNLLMLEEYLRVVAQHGRVALGSTYRGFVQNLYRDSGSDHPWWQRLVPQDVILVLHSIYVLTDFRDRMEIRPIDDLLSFLTAMYAKLRDEGSIFVVYADQKRSYLGEASLHYFDSRGPVSAENIRRVWEARERVFEMGEARIHLNAMFPDFRCEFKTFRTESKVFGDTMDDLIAYCSLGELAATDDSPYDLDKLVVCSDFIARHAQDFEFAVETKGPRAGMVSARAPQVVCGITKRRA